VYYFWPSVYWLVKKIIISPLAKYRPVLLCLRIVYSNNNGDAAQVKDVTIINLRTGKTITPPLYPPAANFVAGFVLIASDGTKDEYSAEGDDVSITATSVTTGQVKKAIIKVSGGGCNCHIAKVSGPETVKFD
jgi:hypothetical protein